MENDILFLNLAVTLLIHYHYSNHLRTLCRLSHCLLFSNITAILEAVLHSFNHDILQMTITSCFPNKTFILWEIVMVIITS